jgi:glycosyltransferase involved in cell wall biosynthesis
MGFANGLYLYDDLPYMQNMKFLDKVKFNLKKIYHKQLLKNHTDLYVVQTEDMKNRFSKFINKPKNLISVVSGRYHSVFEKEIKELDLLPIKEKGEFWFVTISAYYSHKKLDVINELVEFVKEKNFNIKFILTIPDEILELKFKNSKDYIINLGVVKLEECPYIYQKCDALFLPTLIESFSASYPEAMKMGKPILTSDYSFATSVCKDSALYFNPYNIEDIKKQVYKIYSDKILYKVMVNKGLEIVEELPSTKQRAKEYIKLCKEITNNVQK